MEERSRKYMEDIRKEYLKIAAKLLENGRKYANREAQLETLHALGKQNYSGDIGTVKRNDLVLADLSGASRTLAEIGGSLAGIYQSELAHFAEVRRRMRTENGTGGAINQIPGPLAGSSPQAQANREEAAARLLAAQAARTTRKA